MSDKNHKDGEIVNAFSPDYVSQIKPFRPRATRVPVLEQGKYNVHESIATPDEGKRARLLKSRI